MWLMFLLLTRSRLEGAPLIALQINTLLATLGLLLSLPWTVYAVDRGLKEMLLGTSRSMAFRGARSDMVLMWCLARITTVVVPVVVVV